MHHRYYFMRSIGTDSRRPVVLRVCVVALLVVYSLTLATQHDAVAAERSVSFVNDVMPVFTKAGCNVGVCHAKAGGGQKGFQLSLLGFEPLEDFEHVVNEGRGRRLSVGRTGPQLVAAESFGTSAARRRRASGLRLGRLCLDSRLDSPGAPLDSSSAPQLVAFEVEPNRATIQRGGQQQLKAVARYSDGSVRDVTGPRAVRVQRSCRWPK